MDTSRLSTLPPPKEKKTRKQFGKAGCKTYPCPSDLSAQAPAPPWGACRPAIAATAPMTVPNPAQLGGIGMQPAIWALESVTASELLLSVRPSLSCPCGFFPACPSSWTTQLFSQSTDPRQGKQLHASVHENFFMASTIYCVRASILWSLLPAEDQTPGASQSQFPRMVDRTSGHETGHANISTEKQLLKSGALCHEGAIFEGLWLGAVKLREDP